MNYITSLCRIVKEGIGRAVHAQRINTLIC